jgi:hypothetical protein
MWLEYLRIAQKVLRQPGLLLRSLLAMVQR